MLYIAMIILSVIADQAVKAYVVAHIPLFGSQPLLPGVVELYYVRNTGGGFSILTGYTWLLTAVTVLMLAGVAFLLLRRVFPHPMARWALTLILSGGLGNLVDRIRLGYVVDMFHLEFFPSYPVFNVADILVVAGVLLFAVYYLFFHDRARRGGETPAGPGTEVPHEPDDPASAS